MVARCPPAGGRPAGWSRPSRSAGWRPARAWSSTGAIRWSGAARPSERPRAGGTAGRRQARSGVAPGRYLRSVASTEQSERAAELRQLIEYHTRRYFVDDDPEITDA